MSDKDTLDMMCQNQILLNRNLQLKNICQCQTDVTTLQEQLAKHEDIMDNYNKLVASRNRWLENHTAWTNCLDRYDCKKSGSGDYRSMLDLRDRMSQSEFKDQFRQIFSEPRSDSGNEWLGRAEPPRPNPPKSSNISCCAQVFSNISAEKINLEAVQDCKLEINKQFDESKNTLVTLAPGEYITPSSVPTQTTKKPSSFLPYDDSTNTTIMTAIIIMIICSCIVCFVLSSGGGIILTS